MAQPAGHRRSNIVWCTDDMTCNLGNKDKKHSATLFHVCCLNQMETDSNYTIICNHIPWTQMCFDVM